MRSFRHLTPKFIYNRLKLANYHRRFPDHPWLTEIANMILSTYLRPTDHGIEFGSGRSTLWFARHVKSLTSVEHDKQWHESVSKQLKQMRIENVRYFLREPDILETIPIEWDEKGIDSSYVKVIDEFEDDSLDFSFVDGVYRGPCALKSVKKIRPGGFIVIDNAHFWLPRPESAYMPCEAPHIFTRTPKQGPASKQWAEFQDIVRDWRYIYTSDGTQNTALYFKPCSR